MLFVAVALFGLISYVFLQNTRGNIGMIGSEAAKASGYQSADCANAVNMAMKRLNARGCTGMISLEADGSNPAPGAPTDGSCSIYHSNGGGAKPCTGLGAPAAPCTVPNIGDACPDGSVYAGITPDGNTRMYTTPSDGPLLPWNNGNTSGYVTAGATSATSGTANTAILTATDSDSTTPGFQPHQAAQYCADLVAHSHDDWYLPSGEELFALCNESASIGGFNVGGDYFAGRYKSSSEGDPSSAFISDFSDCNAWGGSGSKPHIQIFRCVRKD